MTQADREVLDLVAATRLLGWSGDVVGPVSFGGVTFWAVTRLDTVEHARRVAAGEGAIVGQRELLELHLTAADAGSRGVVGCARAAVSLAGAIVRGSDPRQAIQHASFLSGYSPRAVLLDDRVDLLPVLVDAAVLDQGVVVTRASGAELLAQPGPRVAGTVFNAREWDLLETVYANWLDRRPVTPGRSWRGSAQIQPVIEFGTDSSTL
ncbi:MAG: hypothetical protein M3Z25_14580 [Actinomycetota bacterium]|nr:hypothetical protein [Actinomycetota bacterium]